MCRLLQRRFVIHDRQTASTDLLQVLQFRLKNPLHDETVGWFDTCVEKQRCDNRLKSVHQQRRLAATTALFFTLSETLVFADFQLPSRTAEFALTHDMRTQLR